MASEAVKIGFIILILFVCFMLWVRKQIKFGYSCSIDQMLHSGYGQSSFGHETLLAWHQHASLVQDLAEKAPVIQLDSYQNESE